MSTTDDAFELLRRERDRECRKNFGFGLDEIPPMASWEAKARKDAADAVGACNNSGRRPTYRQSQKIETYNDIARRYRALADAEFRVRVSEINKIIGDERRRGAYVEPVVSDGSRIIAAFLLIPCIWFATWVPGGTTFWALFGTLLSVGTALLMWCLATQPPEDHRIAEARKGLIKIYEFWKPIS